MSTSLSNILQLLWMNLQRDEFNAIETLDQSFEEVDLREEWRRQQIVEEVSIIRKNKVPKANEIVNTARDTKKSIYSFKVQAESLPEKCMHGQPLYDRKQPERSQPKPTVLNEYFNPSSIVYDKYNTGLESFRQLSIFSLDKIRKIRKEDLPISYFTMQTKPYVVDGNLVFDSRFQSGNLAFVSKVSETEYNLLLQNDINTNGYSNWFYFKVSNRGVGSAKFNILNYGKAGWMFNQGMGILSYSKKAFSEKAVGWVRSHQNVMCYKNNIHLWQGSTYSNYNTLTFQFNFEYNNDQTYFAYSVPYTYTDLCQFLDGIESKSLPYFHRKLIGRSLAGNRLEMVTISNREQRKPSATIEQAPGNKQNQKPAIIIVCRSHPGQTVSSWILKGLIEFLVSRDQTAQYLRQNFSFKIIPMMNPDGVIHGNYRCSLSGRDLNRRWKKPDRNLYPEVYLAKKNIMEIAQNRNIELVLDLHGHSRRKKMFIYGCNDRMNPMKCRQFPYLLSKFNSNFQYRYCNFLIEKYKESTARVTLFRKFRIPTIFTLECYMCGSQQAHFSIKDLKQMGQSIAKAISAYFKPSRHKTIGQTDNKSPVGAILKELWENEELMKIGNNKDEGSQSEPSLDNIPLQQINKICKEKQRKALSVQTISQKPSTCIQPQKPRPTTSNSVSRASYLIPKSSSIKIAVFEKGGQYESIQIKKPGSARKPPPSNSLFLNKDAFNLSSKNINFQHLQHKPMRQVKFINFPLMLHSNQSFLKFHNFFNKTSVSRTASLNKTLNTMENQTTTAFRARNFIRSTKNKRLLFRANI